MTPSRSTITALRQETEGVLTGFAQGSNRGNRNDMRKVVDLLIRCRLALAVSQDDGLGPWESPELEYALHIASRHHLPKLALLCACEVLVMGEKSMGVMNDCGFLALLA